MKTIKTKELGYDQLPIRRMQPWIFEQVYCWLPKELVLFISFQYDNSEIIIYEVNDMKGKYLFEIPYGEREKWKNTCFLLNKEVGTKGMFILFVSNIPYNLKCFVLMESMNHLNKIKQICDEQNISLIYDKGIDEFLKESVDRAWNQYSFYANMNEQDFYQLFDSLFLFPSVKELQHKGYDWNKDIKKKSVFISYAWKDKIVVRDIAEKLQESGINIFIDKQSIDYGENILEKIIYGLQECDMAIFFISNAFKESSMGRNELLSIWSKVIAGSKKFIIVKLDDVDPDEIYFSLRDIKYFDYENEPLSDLLSSIHRRLKVE